MRRARILGSAFVVMCFVSSCRRAGDPGASGTSVGAAPTNRVSHSAASELAPEGVVEGAAVETDAQKAVAVVRDYYRAIASHDYDRAYASWGSSGPPGQTRAKFIQGFADTASVNATTGTPSRIEGAAGSRYIEVPIAITSTAKSGTVQRFVGSYTLRRSVVDGASPQDRVWHLDHASIHQTHESGT
ncbi:MAG: hypothetical protein JO197_22795 [Acidobacteria bacterium]|nr:hypothetical protein [Acidobacteriota bacterium]